MVPEKRPDDTRPRAQARRRAQAAIPPSGLNPAEYRKWLREQRRAAPAERPGPFETVCMADVTVQPIGWLWPGRLPRGKLVTLDGDPGTGKSTVTLDWAARVSRGARWPDGAPCHRGAVLVLSAEDGASDTIRPRLEAAGADLTRVFTLKGHASLPTHLDSLEREIRARHATLVIIDVLMAYLGDDLDTHRDQAMRRALARVAEVAERTGACIVAIRHLNKATGQSAVYRGGGSIGIIGQARAAFLTAAVPGNEGKRVLAPIKVNVAKLPASLAYRIVSDERHQCGRIEWEGACGQSADDLLADPGDDRKAHQNDAARWLDDYMRECHGEAKAADVLREGTAVGFNKNDLHHARLIVGVKTGRPAFTGPWLWTCDKYRDSQCHEDPGSQ